MSQSFERNPRHPGCSCNKCCCNAGRVFHVVLAVVPFLLLWFCLDICCHMQLNYILYVYLYVGLCGATNVTCTECTKKTIKSMAYRESNYNSAHFDFAHPLSHSTHSLSLPIATSPSPSAFVVSSDFLSIVVAL